MIYYPRALQYNIIITYHIHLVYTAARVSECVPTRASPEPTWWRTAVRITRLLLYLRIIIIIIIIITSSV